MEADITVVIPYRNEKANIEFTLERVGVQTLPARAAILVNSSSTDDTFEVVERWIRNNQHRFATRFCNVFEHTDNPASSKNVGVRRARSEWVAFMDCGQNFGRDWLEKQVRYAREHGVDVVSGVVYLTGENWVDRCAVAQTYGYRRCRPCVPTTLVRKSVFDRTGPFLEERRAGYDVAWIIRLNRLGINRGINEDVRIAYIGFNFASSLPRLYRKSVLYAKPAVAIEGYRTPYLYALLSLALAGALAWSIKLACALLLLYFVVRAYGVPLYKSRSVAFFREHPTAAWLGLGVVGMVIDLGKLVGTWQGIYFYFVKPHLSRR